MRVPSLIAVAALLLSPTPLRAEATPISMRASSCGSSFGRRPAGTTISICGPWRGTWCDTSRASRKPVPVNMPGGGGLTALNYTANVAPQDGTVLTMVTQTTPMDQALGRDKALTVDMRKLNWIGNMSDENLFLVTTRASQTKISGGRDQAGHAAGGHRCGRGRSHTGVGPQQRARHEVQKYPRIPQRPGNESRDATRRGGRPHHDQSARAVWREPERRRRFQRHLAGRIAESARSPGRSAACAISRGMRTKRWCWISSRAR